MSYKGTRNNNVPRGAPISFKLTNLTEKVWRDCKICVSIGSSVWEEETLM